ncbi:CotH kinase family protein [Crocinitomix catalasitica]|nr:CotH kinase family protein [Crocinitomix catalasitica]
MKKLLLLVLLSSYSHVQSSWSQNLTSTNLPIIKIYTGGAEIPDDPKIIGTMGIINGSGETNNITDPYTDYYGNIGIETRGNSTQEYDKKTYSFELRTAADVDTSVSLLGMPSEEDWILHNMVIDKSLIRIPMSFYFMQEMGHYAARWRFVEVMLNDDYRGVYILTERIKRDKNRVNIAKLEATEISGDEKTGGYILRIDWNEGEGVAGIPTGFDSEYKSVGGEKMFYQYYYPKAEKIQAEQKSYIKGYMDEFEQALWSSTKHNNLGNHYSQYFDLTSLADFIIINELSRNSDGYKLSTYIHKENINAGNKFKSGPMWDFDQTYGMSTVCGGDETDGWNYTQEHKGCSDFISLPKWYYKIMNDPLFQNHLKCRWELHRAGVLHKDSINDWIDSTVNFIDAAKDRNFLLWEFIGQEIWSEPDPFPETYDEEISWMKTWISDRIDWLDTNIPGDCSGDLVGLIVESNLMFNAYPNPTQSTINVNMPYHIKGMKYRMIDLQGREVLNGNVLDAEFALDISFLAEGVYVLEVNSMMGEMRRRIVKS